MKIRCIHRHTIEEHPSCFARGLIDGISEKEFVKKTGLPWYQYPNYKMGYLDIETSTLNANNGYILSWCLKEKGGEIFSDIITKKDINSYNFDLRLLKNLLSILIKYKIIVTYYGDGFDIPFIRTRALIHGLTFPAYGELYTFDLYWTVKNKLKLTSNSLDSACNALGIEGKNHIDWKTWNKAAVGNKEALAEVLFHNQEDVIILEQLHERILPFRKWIKKSV